MESARHKVYFDSCLEEKWSRQERQRYRDSWFYGGCVSDLITLMCVALEDNRKMRISVLVCQVEDRAYRGFVLFLSLL